MYLRVYFEGLGEAVALVESHEEEVRRELPFESRAEVWKEEVYFATPIAIEGEGTATVRAGDLAYWRPERCLCLFYGISQPYGTVVRLGRVLGPLHYLRWVEAGTRVEVSSHVDYGRAAGVAERLRATGYPAAARTWEEAESVVAVVGGVGVEVFVEDYGLIVEGDTLFRYDQSLGAVGYVEALRDALERESVRVDLNEEGYVILSTYAPDPEALPRALEALRGGYERARALLRRR